MSKINKPNKICCSKVLKYFYVSFFILFIGAFLFLYSFLNEYVYTPIFSDKFSNNIIKNVDTEGVDVVEFIKADEKVERVEKNLQLKNQRKELSDFRNIFR